MSAQFDHEKLDVYRLELDFIRWVTPLLKECRLTDDTGELRNQLDRASLSMLLNTAEGNGKRQNRSRAKFFDDARGSSTECAACLDALVVKGACTDERVIDGKKSLVRIVSMLSKLIDRFGGPERVCEDMAGYGCSPENDDEDEDDNDMAQHSERVAEIP